MVTKLLGILLLALAFSASAADETFRTLKVKDEVYTNVTITSTSETDIYFSHSRGMASAKLKDLDPALQKHFHYDAAKSAKIETERREATASYKANLPKTTPPAKTFARDDSDDFVAPKLNARSIRGQSLPAVEIAKWLTDAPDIRQKFVLIDFWATWCGPCRQSIPELNAFQAKFANRLVIIGISDESEKDIRKMVNPHIDYAVATDPQQRMLHNLEVTAIPHCLLVDPSGIVRFEGNPLYLDDQKLQHFLDKYSQ